MSRLEHDLLGDRELPDHAYYGVHTLRAIENFPVTGIPLAAHPDLVAALANVKHAAAQTNCELGLLDPQLADAIIAACKGIRDGALHDQFVVDVIQGGAGTSTNMNANEVIANRALELLGHPRGSYQILHPLDHAIRIVLCRPGVATLLQHVLSTTERNSHVTREPHRSRHRTG